MRFIQEKYVRDNSSNYMMIESSEKPGEESYQIKMLIKNTVSKFLPISLRSINNSQIYCYDISSKQPLSRMYEGNNITKDDVLNIAMHISQVIKIADEYLLELDNIVLNAKLMYMNISDKALYFTYYPYVEQEFGESLKELFEYILEHLDHSDKKAVILTYGIYQKILQNDYSLENIVHTILEQEKKDSDTKVQKINNISSNITPQNVEHNRVIESILTEEIQDEKEVKSNYISDIIKLAKGIIGIVIIFTIFNVALPQYRIIKISLLTAFIVILFCIILCYIIDWVYKKNKMRFTKIIKNNSNMKYSIPKEKNNVIVDSVNPIKDMDIYEKDNIDIKNKENATGDLNLEQNKENLLKAQNEYCVTQLLSDYIQETTKDAGCRLVLHGENTNEKNIIIDEYPFIIGSLSSNCNYSIDNKLVSRMHLRVTKEKTNQNYFVEDLNSKNGTYVNEEKVEPNQKVQIMKNDIVTIAVIQYRFEIDL